jgi:hypothetical protein
LRNSDQNPRVDDPCSRIKRPRSKATVLSTSALCSDAASEISNQIGDLLVRTVEGAAQIPLIASKNQAGGRNSWHGPAAGSEKNREASFSRWTGGPNKQVLLRDSPSVSRSFVFASLNRLAFRSSPFEEVAPGFRSLPLCSASRSPALCL